MWSNPHPASFTPGKTRYTLYRRLGGPQGQAGRVRKISPPTGIRSPDRPAQASRYNDYGILAHKAQLVNKLILSRIWVMLDSGSWHQGSSHVVRNNYGICSRNLRTFFYFGRWKTWLRKICWFFFLWMSWSGFYSSILVVPRNISLLICTTLYNYYSSFPSWNVNTSAH